MRVLASVLIRPSPCSITPNSSSPRNFTNGFTWKALIWLLNSGLNSPDHACALVVATAFSSTR